VVTEEFVAQINSYKLIERETINNMQHCPNDDDYDNDGDGDDHLTYEERLRVDSYKMLMPIIHLPYKPNKYQYRLCNKSLYRHDDTVSHQRRRQQGIVRRVSDDNVDVSGVVSDEDESKADTKEDEDEDCKTHERRTKENNKEEDDKQHEVGYQCQMSIKIKAKTCDGEVLILKDKSTTTTSTENKC